MAKDVAVSAEMSNSLMGLAAELGWHDLAAAGDHAAILGRASLAPAQQLRPVNSRRLVVKVRSGVKPAVVSMQPPRKVG